MPGRVWRISLLVLLGGIGLGGCQPVQVARAWVRPHSDLLTLPADPRVRYTEGAQVLAREVAATLPQQVSRVETAGGRMFLGPVEVRVYGSEQGYRNACAATKGQRSTLIDDALCLSPTLAGRPAALPEEVAYQLTRFYLRQYTGSVGWYTYLPDWFSTGYAQLVAGSSPVDGARTARAILSGRHFKPSGKTHPLDRRPDLPLPLYRSEARMFVKYLRAQNPAAFRRLLHRVMERHRFGESFAVTYGGSVAQQWQGFIASLRG